MARTLHEKEPLPLRRPTPDRWATTVLRDPIALLVDHAHLERKAASNALELLGRWYGKAPSKRWTRVLSSVARDETSHLSTVVRLLQRRGGHLSRVHQNQYARELRALVRRGRAAQELVDRLLVSALIELRSCERFEILGRLCEDEELRKLYRSLWGSEHGHSRVFLELAAELLEPAELEERWSELLDAEAAIIRQQPPGPRMHSWV